MADQDAGLVVRDVSVRPVVVPLRRPLATKVGDFSAWPLLLIDVLTEQGITGRGYLAPYLSRATAGLRTVLDHRGAWPARPAGGACCGLRRRPGLAQPGRAPYQGLALAAVAGLDIALWDALAQAAGLPLAVLLGGTLAPVPAYNSNGLELIPPGASPPRRWNCSKRAGSRCSRSGSGGRTRPTTSPRSAGSGPPSATR